MPTGSDTLPAKQGAAGADCAEAWDLLVLDQLDAGCGSYGMGFCLEKFLTYTFLRREFGPAAVLTACLSARALHVRARSRQPYHSHVHMTACRVA